MPKKLKKVKSLNLSSPKWVVCLTLLGIPATWGKLITMDEMRTIVEYYGPIWESNLWLNDFILVFNTEAEARKKYEDYHGALKS